jgi:hypothetical protein
MTNKFHSFKLNYGPQHPSVLGLVAWIRTQWFLLRVPANQFTGQLPRRQMDFGASIIFRIGVGLGIGFAAQALGIPLNDIWDWLSP